MSAYSLKTAILSIDVYKRQLKEEDMKVIVDMIDRILSNIDDENVIAEVKKEVNAMMNPRPMFAW